MTGKNSDPSSVFRPNWYDFLCQNDTDEKTATGRVPRKRGLLDDHPENTLDDKLLIHVVNSEKRRYFSVFQSFLEFARYNNSIKEDKRNFFETILGNRCQKPHFDIDIDIKENPDIDGSEVLENLIDSILDVLSESDVEIVLAEHILIFNSHGHEKRSYHLVIDSYMHLNNLEAKAFYNEVVSRMTPDYSKFVDKSVYSSKQQFRVLGSQKPGSGRIKVHMDKWKYHDDEIEYLYSCEPRDEYHKFILQLSSSLITNTNGCIALPNFVKVDDSGKMIRKYITYGPDGSLIETNSSDSHIDEDLPKDIAMKALNLLAEFAGMTPRDKKFPYRLLNISGGIISLKRIIPSMCRVCERRHENENPYLFVIGDEYTVFFNCRRNDKNLKIGKLGKQNTNNPDPESAANSDEEKCTSIPIFMDPDVVGSVRNLATRSSTAFKPVVPRNPANQQINSKYEDAIASGYLERDIPWKS